MQQLLTGKKRFPEFVKSTKTKKTKLGMIPEDWDSLRLSEVCHKITDGAHLSPKTVDIKEYPIYSVKNMKENGLTRDEPRYISKNDYSLLVSQGCKPDVNDILIAKDGSVMKYSFVVKK